MTYSLVVLEFVVLLFMCVLLKYVKVGCPAKNMFSCFMNVDITIIKMAEMFLIDIIPSRWPDDCIFNTISASFSRIYY